MQISLNITPQSLRPPRRPVHIDPFRRVKNLREKFGDVISHHHGKRWPLSSKEVGEGR